MATPGGMRRTFNALEWFFTAIFTAEYIARLACVERPKRYARSFFGVVDLLAVLPTYLALLLPQLGVLMDIRLLRLLRVFRILKLASYITEYQALGAALYASRRKIFVFWVLLRLSCCCLARSCTWSKGPPMVSPACR